MKERGTWLLALAALAFLLCCLPGLVEGPAEAPDPAEPPHWAKPLYVTAAILQGEGSSLPEGERRSMAAFQVQTTPEQPARRPVATPHCDSNGHPLTLTAAYVDAVHEAFPPESVKG